MKDFFILNSLNFFSLMILILLISHAIYYFGREEEPIRKVWRKVILIAIIAQVLDIASWYITRVPTTNVVVLSYIINTLLFATMALLALQVALFIYKNIEFSKEGIKVCQKIFIVLISANFLLLLLSIPFGWVFSVTAPNIYVRGEMFLLMLSLLLLPLVIVLVRLLSKHRLGINKLIRDNKLISSLIAISIIGIVGILFLQVEYPVPVSILMPFVTLFLLLLHLMSVTNMVLVDAPTGLQNTLGAEKYFAKLPRHSTEYFGVLFFDMDNLKELNDKFGHKEGDFAIKNFASILQSEIKNKDLAARVGGDEFLIVTSSRTKEDFKYLIKKIEEQVNLFNSRLEKYEIAYSYGMALAEPNSSICRKKLIQEADENMYKNKNEKKERLAKKINTD